VRENTFISSAEKLAEEAFSRQSAIFDSIYQPNIIIQYKRERVWKHVEKYLSPQSNILELNSGTGEDAVHFAGQHHHVHATDISTGMQDMLAKKVASLQLSNVTNELCSFSSLENLKARGPYDLIFSNFAGLNCTGDLKKVLTSFSPLLKPGGYVTLVIMPGFCLWETMLALKGNFKLAFRRFNSKNGVPAHIEGIHFTCWYYKPSFIIDCLKNDFRHISTEGLCTTVPPSYLENFPLKYPRAFKNLKSIEEKLCKSAPWKSIGDYFIITLQKK